ncbi:MAG TPA: RICIN domain-containing protein [Polyangia bacterium]|nr:RICIN domain-containing protein [Polyangia bacterium]
MGDLGKRSIQISVTLGAIVSLVGCGAEQSDVQSGQHDFALSSVNGLSAINGLSSVNGLSAMNGLSAVNGLSSVNGLSAMNGLSSVNGLSAVNGLMTTSAGRRTVSYLAKCALAANDSLVKQDQNGVNYTYAGGIGLCPGWKNGDVHTDATCMEGVSACLMAHVNTAGIHVPLWLDSNDPAIGWGVDRVNYPMQEGTFFGDIIDTGSLSAIAKPGMTAPVAYYCDGAGFPGGASGVVAGRLGANQSGAPYSNPFGSGVLCQNAPNAVGQFSQGVGGSCPAGSNSSPSAGCPDGYKALTTNGNSGVWQHGITVWRNNNYVPVFDTGYIYRIAPYLANFGESVDVMNGSTADGTLIQQWGSWNGTPQMFTLVADGSSWHVAMTANTAKCVDLVGGGSSLGNGTQLAINDCKMGDTSQEWTISPDPQTGAFFLKNVQSGRCFDENNSNTSSGVIMEIWDCNNGPNQKFYMQAYPTN